MSDKQAGKKGMFDAIRAEAKLIEEYGLALDIYKWAKMSSWTLKEVSYIVHGIDPNRGLMNHTIDHLAINQAIKDTYDILERAASDGKIPQKGDPALFFDWLDLIGLNVTEKLKTAVLEAGNKRDIFELEKIVRSKDTIYGLESEMLGGVKPGTVFSVNNVKAKEPFFEEIKNILREKSKVGERKPSASELREFICNNANKLPHFHELNSHNDIVYRISQDGSSTKKLTRDALQKLITRYTAQD